METGSGAGRGSRRDDRLRHGPEAVERAVSTVRERWEWAEPHDSGPGSYRPGGFRPPRVALVLGSGLGGYVDGVESAMSIPFEGIPGFPSSSIPGHAGRLVFGTRGGIPAVVQAGRFHIYEGLSAAEVAFPVRVLHGLGIRALVVTNAAGGVDPGLRPGDLLLLEDHIHFQFRNPLRGRGPLLDATRFVDLAAPYSPRLLNAARAAARSQGIPRVLSGVYWSTLGPSYETPAEVRMIRRLGGQAVGMSTVNEVLVARQLGMEVLGIATIANPAAGLGGGRLSHEDVLSGVALAADRLGRLLDALLPDLENSTLPS